MLSRCIESAAERCPFRLRIHYSPSLASSSLLLLPFGGGSALKLTAVHASSARRFSVDSDGKKTRPNRIAT